MFSAIYVTLPTAIVQAPSKGLLHRKWRILHKALSPHFFPKKFQTKCSTNAPLVTHIGDSSLGWLGLNSTWAWKLLYLFLLNPFQQGDFPVHEIWPVWRANGNTSFANCSFYLNHQTNGCNKYAGDDFETFNLRVLDMLLVLIGPSLRPNPIFAPSFQHIMLDKTSM